MKLESFSPEKETRFATLHTCWLKRTFVETVQFSKSNYCLFMNNCALNIAIETDMLIKIIKAKIVKKKN